MAPLAPTLEGNTSRVSASKYWCFTFNNYEKHGVTVGSMKDSLSKIGYYQFGEEVGDNGTPHFQGFVQLRKKGRPSELIKIPQIHWEKANGNEKQNLKYTGKSGLVHTNIEKLIDPLEGKTLFDWQQEIVDICHSPLDFRKVHWYWNEVGGNGKTSFARHLVIDEDDILYVAGASKDVKFAFMQLKKKPKVVFFNIVRTPEHEDKVSYQSLEELKDGIFFSTKYESGMCVFNPPHVIVLANFHPDTLKLSEDRWHIRYINN